MGNQYGRQLKYYQSCTCNFNQTEKSFSMKRPKVEELKVEKLKVEKLKVEESKVE